MSHHLTLYFLLKSLSSMMLLCKKICFLGFVVVVENVVVISFVVAVDLLQIESVIESLLLLQAHHQGPDAPAASPPLL